MTWLVKCIFRLAADTGRSGAECRAAAPTLLYPFSTASVMNFSASQRTLTGRKQKAAGLPPLCLSINTAFFHPVEKSCTNGFPRLRKSRN